MPKIEILLSDYTMNTLNFDMPRWWDSINEMVNEYLKTHKTGYDWTLAVDYNAFRSWINRLLKLNLNGYWDIKNEENEEDED